MTVYVGGGAPLLL